MIITNISMAAMNIIAMLAISWITVTSSIVDQTYFEILKPIAKPSGARRCSTPVLKNYVFGKAPFTASFSPPSACGTSWSLITLSWSAYLNTTSSFYSPGNVFIDGVNILKTSAQVYAPEIPFDPYAPRDAAVRWSFEIDVTKYGAYLKKTRILTVNFPLNPAAYGSYLKANLTLNYYVGPTSPHHANVILPLSPPSKPNFPFNITNTSNKGQVSLSGLPRNIYRAEIEIFQLQGGSDESYWWYYPSKETPNVFRETLVYIDGLLAGAIWPFLVLLGADSNSWKTPQFIGTYVRPIYKIDVTPFVGLLVNGKPHNITLTIVGAPKGSSWELSGVLHLWLDANSKQTSGKLISRQIVNVVTPTIVHKYEVEKSKNATTTAKRNSTIVGSVSTSFGNFTATSISSRYLLNDLRWTSVLEIHTQLIESWNNATHKVSGRNSIDMKFKNGSRLFYYEDSFSVPFVNTHFYDGLFDRTSRVNVGHILSTTTQYGKSAFRVDSLSNTQSLSTLTGYKDFSSGSFSQRFSYRSNFSGCSYKKVDVNSNEAFSTQGRNTC